MIKRVARRFLNSIHELFLEFCYTHNFKQDYFQKSFESKITPEQKRFIKINEKNWTTIKGNEAKGYSLVEGYLSGAGQNYVLRTGMVAKAVEDETGCVPMVIFDRSSHRSAVDATLYRSFNISHFFYFQHNWRSPWFRVKSLLFAVAIFFRYRDGDKLLSLKRGNILIGDLIYDDLIRQWPNVYTIEKLKIRWKYFRIFWSAYFHFFAYEDIFLRCKIRYVVNTHILFIQYGMLARLGLYHGAHVFDSTDLYLGLYTLSNINNTGFGIYYHEGMRYLVQQEMKRWPEPSKIISIADEFLARRFSGATKQYDVDRAFNNKKQYSKAELFRQLSIAHDKPCVLVFSHVFSDGPHSSRFTLFRDYYDWFIQTLDYIRTVEDVHWFIKPHPSSALYGEGAVIEKAIASHSHGHIHLVPDDCSTSSLKDIADVVTTVQGTPGIEFSCFGIPAIITGTPFYSGFGFTHEPKSKAEYFEMLKNVGNIKRLSKDQVEKAKIVFACEEMSLFPDNNLINMTALNDIWGYAKEGRNLERGAAAINDNLEKFDPKEEIIWKKAKQCLETN